MDPILAYMNQHANEMVEDLKTFVGMESPSTDKAAVDRLSRHLAGLFAEAGAKTEFIRREERGDLLRAAYGPGREEGQTLVLCHMDTVFTIGDIAKNPLRIENGRLYGPGTSDMKAGFTILLWAMRALKALNLTPRRTVVGLLTSDEEVGSAASREAIEAEARRSAIALVAEPAMPPKGALKTWRKGTADYKLIVTGKAAHAGADPTKGVSAVEELAHHILALQKLTDMSVGTTVNVGVIHGGTRTNVVPAQATADIDVRFMTMEEAYRIDGIIKGLKAINPAASIKVEGGINRPPMVRNEATIELFGKARAIAADLGFEIDEAGTGGGSDGNFTSGAGCPTLDGLGACGDGLHTFEEFIVVESLPQRAALMARLLMEG